LLQKMSSCPKTLPAEDSAENDMKRNNDESSGSNDIVNQKDDFGTLTEIATLVQIYSDFLRYEGTGRICIVGGSISQITDIFWTMEAALQCRAEVITVLSTPRVANLVKLYNSCLKVLPYLPEVDYSKADEFVTKVWPLVKDNDAFCFGIGFWLQVTENAIEKLIMRARTAHIPIVLCSCALELLKKKPSLISRNLPEAPVLIIVNEEEFGEIWSTLHSGGIMSFRENSKDLQPHPTGNLTAYPYTEEFSLKNYPDAFALNQTAQISNALGSNVVILRMGLMDIIAHSRTCFLFGGPKFSNVCIGQECLLVGLVTVFLSWLNLQGRITKPMIAAYSADFVVRLASLDAYNGLEDGDEFGAAVVAKVIPSVLKNIIDGVP